MLSPTQINRSGTGEPSNSSYQSSGAILNTTVQNETQTSKSHSQVVEDGRIVQPVSNSGLTTSLISEDGSPIIKARSYQVEMLEESLKKNIIVAMDTGSGKTHIAVMRIIHELDRMQPYQLIWFLCPTVTLCSQQHEYIKTQINFVQTKLLSGADNVDRWKEHTWDAVLKNTKIVVSTYQILLDALSHGFVTMRSLALIIFDECHHAIGKHPGSKIMKLFYHNQKKENSSLPGILGLSASPVMRNKAASIVTIEQTLSAIARTPTKHRSELRLQVKLPILSRVYYQSLPLEHLLSSYTKSLVSLGQVLRNLEITEDPSYLRLLHADDERSVRTLEKLKLSQKTWSRTQIKSFYSTSLRVCRELGGWAADYYISAVVNQTIKLAENRQNILSTSWDVSAAERQYLAKVLKQVEITHTACLDPAQVPLISDKVVKLLEVLTQGTNLSSGIVFVEERATAAVLANLISIHPLTRQRFKVQAVVGSSGHDGRSRSIGDLIDVDSSNNALANFKTGETNIIIATSVVEEGIDIPSCNLVVCFQKPANLKSFVQRRGRARHHESKLILLLDSDDSNITDFEQCEMDMRAIYEDDMRQLQEILVEEDVNEESDRVFVVETTGATLDLDNSISHLYHFCATLPAQYIDLRPDFICYKDTTNRIRARVILPLSVHESVRTYESAKSWKSERSAIKDASFEAYVGLYKAGLISENLLPLFEQNDLLDNLHKVADTRVSKYTVNEVLNPWIDVAKEWKEPNIKLTSLSVSFEGTKYQVLLPRSLLAVPTFPVYWDSETELLVDITTNSATVDLGSYVKAQKDTNVLLKAGFGHRIPILTKDFVMPILVDNEKMLEFVGCQPLSDDLCLSKNVGLVRDILEPNKAYIFQKWIPRKPAIENGQTVYQQYDETPENQSHVSLKRLGRRADFLHKDPHPEFHAKKEFSMILPVTRCMMDNMPFKFVRFALMIPSIMRRVELSLIADRLSKHILPDVDISLILTSICSSGAEEATNYQRLEFLGDSVLKLCASIQLMAEYPLYPEGYLTMAKARVISNYRLCKAALETGLDNYIITKKFTGLKWRPLYIDNALESSNESKREISSKTLADVVEALVGAAVTAGGLPRALTCLQTFIPEIDWQPLEHRREFLYARASEATLPFSLEPLEKLLGYNFKKKGLLVEAITHASCTGISPLSGSFERLEFLGDAILDHIVVTAMSSYDLSHIQMHGLRTALVNASFLAVMSMEFNIEQEAIEVERDEKNLEKGIPKFKEKPSLVSFPLWKFMRHMSPTIGGMQLETTKRYLKVREEFILTMKEGSAIPWALLARIGAPKFYSDMVESLIGAIWIDSGSFEPCIALAEKMGILPYLRRIVKDGVHVLHPKEELGILADQEKVRYIVKNETMQEGEGRDLQCIVMVGDEEIVRVGGGFKNEEVQVKAAEKAVGILKERGKREKKRKEAGL